MRIILLTIIIITFFGCQEKTSSVIEDETVPLTTVDSKEQLIERGNQIGNDLDSMLTDLGVETGATPSIEIKYEPYLIFYDSQNNRVVTSLYKDLPPDIIQFFTELSLQTGMGAEEFYETFFHSFFFIHEFGHWAQFQMDGTFNTNRYVSEMEANEITVFYLQSFEEGREFLDHISPKVDSLVAFLDNPAPEGVSEEQYFNNNYAELGQNPYAYGYYQFKFVKNALKERDKITLEEIVSRRN